MKIEIIFSFALLALSFLSKATALVQLNQQSLEQELSKYNKKAVILIHQEWCNESRELEQFLNSLWQQQLSSDPKTMVNYLVVNLNQQNILADKLPDKGAPAIYFYNDGNFTQYEFDVFSRRQFKYFTDLFFFEKLINVNSIKSLDEQKQKFQFIFVGKKNEYNKVYRTFVDLSKKNFLYTFIESENQEILSRFFIQQDQSDQNEKESESEAAYLIIVRKYDKFDKYLRVLYDNDKAVERMIKFFGDNQKPYRIFTFNHRIRKYLIEKSYYSLTLFYRKKVYQDEYLYQSFYNITRDTKSIIDGKKEDSYNYVSRIKTQIQQEVVFLFIDRFENKLSQKLSEYMEDNSYDNIPSVFIFYFNSKTRSLNKFKFKIKHQDFIIFSELMLFVQSVMHEPSQNQLFFLRNKQLDERILKLNPKILQLNSYFFERSFSDRYLKMMKKEKVINVILFVSLYSRASLQIAPIFSKVQQNLIFSNKVEVQFSFFDISENDQLLYEFKPQVKVVPEIRIYYQRHKFHQIDLSKIDKIIEDSNIQNSQKLLESYIMEMIDQILEKNKKEDL
ncbi:hypothetical protein ABPG72_007040 [Tetrahymena utriculariae]